MNNKPSYPIILIPEAIPEAAEAFPSIQEFKELAPPAPSNEPQPMNLFLIASEAIGVIAFCFGLIAVNLVVAAGLTLAIGIFGIIFHILSEKSGYSQRIFNWEK